MSGTSAHVGVASSLTMPAPKLRARSLPTGPAPVTLHDGGGVSIVNPISVVLDEIPTAALEDGSPVELRLFRYGRPKSASSFKPTPARWAACHHIEGGVNPYDRSQWLGGTCADGRDRISRVLLGGLGYGSLVDLSPLWSSWMKVGFSSAQVTAGPGSVRFPVTTWGASRGGPSKSYGLSGNTEPARFAVAYVAQNDDGYWDRVSSLSRFAITTQLHPWQWDPDDPNNVSPTPTNPGVRIFVPNPNYDYRRLVARITESELLAGGR